MVGAFLGALVTGMLTNLAMLWTFFAGGTTTPIPQTPTRPVPMSSPAPARATVPTRREAAPVVSMQARPRSLGAAAVAPRRYQFENHMLISQGGRTIALPIHQGTADVVLGPVDLEVASGATYTWDPTNGFTAPENLAIFATSDVPAEDSTHAVTVTPLSGGIATALDPAAYVPEAWVLPLTVTNNTSRTAHITAIAWANSDSATTPIDF